MKKTVLTLTMLSALAACDQPADVASHNISKAADNFEVPRKITVVNGITDRQSLVITGFCSLGNHDAAAMMSVTCKTEDGQYIKNFIRLSDNVFVLTEQLAAVDVSTFHYRVAFRPQAAIPDIDFQGSARELTTNRN